MDDFATGYLAGQDSGGGGNYGGGYGGGMFGSDAIWAILLFAMIFGWGRNGNNGFGGNNGGDGCCRCATQADLAAGFNNSAVLSSLDDIKLGQANAINYNNQGFSGLNTALLQGFHGVDNAVCTLGYQSQQGFSGLGAQLAACCCDIERAIDGNTTQGVMNTNAIQQQISKCCCDLEMMNMQNRFDAQNNTCNTLSAIDKLGDRIIGFMTNEKIDSLRAENQTLKFQASQAAQNNYIAANQEAQTAELIRRLGRDVPVPAYVVPTPNCCYGGYGGFGFGNGFGFGRNSDCGCGCGC